MPTFSAKDRVKLTVSVFGLEIGTEGTVSYASYGNTVRLVEYGDNAFFIGYLEKIPHDNTKCQLRYESFRYKSFSGRQLKQFIKSLQQDADRIEKSLHGVEPHVHYEPSMEYRDRVDVVISYRVMETSQQAFLREKYEEYLEMHNRVKMLNQLMELNRSLKITFDYEPVLEEIRELLAKIDEKDRMFKFLSPQNGIDHTILGIRSSTS